MKIGDYVRTKKRGFQYPQIAQIKSMSKDSGYKNHYFIELDHNLLPYYENYIYEEDIAKCSPNIVDVLEEHDFVQMQDRGNRFYEIERDYTGKLSLRDIGWDEYEELDETNIPEIVSIITHEQMEQMKYKVKE